MSSFYPFCGLCHNRTVLHDPDYGTFCFNHISTLLRYKREAKEYREKIINQIINGCKDCNESKYCFRHINDICSEFFYCESCYKNGQITKGFTRYDSLVLCESHNTEFKPIVKQLYDIFDNNPNVTVIH